MSHGNRRSIRLPEYDYRIGTFFVSLVADGRRRIFGRIENKEVSLSSVGRIVEEEWLRTPVVRPSVALDEYIVMPDHFQAIVSINVGIVGGASWRPFQDEWKTYGQGLWQRGYYERIIRSAVELDKVRDYVRKNPEKG